MRPHIIVKLDNESKIKNIESTTPVHILVISDEDIAKDGQVLEIQNDKGSIKLNAHLQDYEIKREIMDYFEEWNTQSKGKERKLLHGEYSEFQARFPSGADKFHVFCKKCGGDYCCIGSTGMFDTDNYLMAVTGLFCENCGAYEHLFYYPVECYEEDAHSYDECHKRESWPHIGKADPDEVSIENYDRHKNDLKKYMENKNLGRKKDDIIID